MSTPPLRRIVTAHDAKAASVIALDETAEFLDIAPGARMSSVWATAAVPVDNNGEPDPAVVPFASEKGSIVRVVDFGPGSESPMHRTYTLDYAIVLSGEVELLLDSGESTAIGPHTLVVQRGTNHLWRNASETETARVLFVLVEAAPVLYRDEPLRASGL